MANPTADRLKQLADNLRTPGYWIPQPELYFLNSVALAHEVYKELLPHGYIGPSGKWWIAGTSDNPITVSLDTGSFFLSYPGESCGNLIPLWRGVKRVSFTDAVKQLTDWCIDRENGVTEPEEEKRKLDTGISLNNLKRLTYQAVFQNGESSIPEIASDLESRPMCRIVRSRAKGVSD